MKISPLFDAANAGDLEAVQRLLGEGSTPSEKTQALWQALEKGHVEIVKLLLPVGYPKKNNGHFLRRAIVDGNLAMVQLLLPLSDVKEADSLALCWALMEDHHDIAKLLIPLSDIHLAMEKLVLSESFRAADTLTSRLSLPHMKTIKGMLQKTEDWQVKMPILAARLMEETLNKGVDTPTRGARRLRL